MATKWESWGAEYPCSDLDETDPALLASLTAAAQRFMWAKTGRRYGVAETLGEKYRWQNMPHARGWLPYSIGEGMWLNAPCGTDPTRIPLHSTPARTIKAVRVNGGTMSPAAYSLEGSAVIAPDGFGASSFTDRDPAPVEIDYTWGVDVPPEGPWAVGEIVCDLVAATEGKPCRMSLRATAITRQGLTVELESAVELDEKGFTGLAIPDMMIRTANPSKLHTRSRVYSPDVPYRAGG